jgi:hypothetical protein
MKKETEFDAIFPTLSEVHARSVFTPVLNEIDTGFV